MDTFNVHIWPTFERIGPFVLSMATCDSERVCTAAPTVNLTLALAQRSAVTPLFPNLQSLAVGRFWLDRGPYILDIHHLNLLGSFLGTAVTRLAIRGYVGCFDVVQLQRTAPKIRGLRLEVSTNQEGTDNETMDVSWISTTMQRLVYCEHLVSLCITSVLLEPTSAGLLGMIPLLSTLVIRGDGKCHWERVAFRPGSFPRLREVATKAVPLKDLIIFLNQPNSARCLTKLYVNVSPAAEEAPALQMLGALTICVRDRHPLVTCFGLKQAAVLPLAVLQPLEALSLSTLVLRHVDFSEDTRSMLLMLHTGLKHLDLGRSPMPPKFLADLAIAYPGLRSLFVMLDLDQCEGVRDNRPSAVAEGPLCLHATACCLVPIHNTEVDNNIEAINR